jgi:hypothetical protein
MLFVIIGLAASASAALRVWKADPATIVRCGLAGGGERHQTRNRRDPGGDYAPDLKLSSWRSESEIRFQLTNVRVTALIGPR